MKFSGSNIIAAWLHDVMEDCGGGGQIVEDTLQQIELPQAEHGRDFCDRCGPDQGPCGEEQDRPAR